MVSSGIPQGPFIVARHPAAVSLTLGVAPALSACEDPETGARRRWAFWRSPPGQPGWARPVLLGIAAVAALLYAWNITSAGLAPFYSVAVKSMSESWKAFFYGAFDPGATITIDKLAGSFLPQALSARIFGYHPWSLALPQVIEGVVSVLVLYRVVRRWAGVVPGLLAAGIFALTPIAASMFGHSMEDGALTMCLVLAADAYQRAVMGARLRSLVCAGVWVGLGFQAKMMQAWMVLPALAIGYLLCAPAPLRRRLWHLGVAGLVTLAVSLSWIALYTFTPASDRPYVDGSTDNSAAAMVFGYNGLERFGVTVHGAVMSVIGGGGRRAASFPGARRFPGASASAGPAQASLTPAVGETADADVNAGGFVGNSGGWTKLADSRFGPEIGWLYPLALLTLAFGLGWRGRAGRTDQVRGGFVMWGTWLLTFGIIFSTMSNIPHTAYMASLAPPLAALSGAGIVLFWRWYRAGDPRGWVLPVAVAAELGWATFLWSGYRSFLPWVLPAAIVAGAAAIVVLGLARLSRRARTRLATAGLAAAVAAMLAAPAAWAASVLDVRYAGSSFDASAGPGGAFGFGGGSIGGGGLRRYQAIAGRYGRAAGPAGVPGAGEPGTGAPGGSGGPGGGLLATANTTLSGSEQRLYAYLTAHRDGASYLMAVQSWSVASPYILATGQEVMPMGGFSGSVPEPTLARVQQLVSSGQLRFFMLGSGAGFGPGAGAATGGISEAQKIASWVEASCAEVPASAYGGTSSTAAPGSGGPFAGLGGTSATLYECAKSD
jgi:4-amino-4-deoxy-L-arabinose transferase-like glycosyltransferase